MALTKKQKNFINQNFEHMSVPELSSVLGIDSSEITSYLKKFGLVKKEPRLNLNSNFNLADNYKSLKETLLENLTFFGIVFLFLIFLYAPSLNSILLSDETTVYQTMVQTGKSTILNSFHSTAFVHIINFTLFGLNGAGFRIVTLVLHMINIILFFYIFRNFFSEKILKIAIVLLASHALISESIIWISANPYVYQALLYLIACALSLKFEESKNKSYLFISFIPLIILTISGGHTNFAPLFYIFFNLFILRRSFKKELIISGWLLFLIPLYPLLNKATVDSRIASLTTGPYVEKFFTTLPFTVAKSLELVIVPYNLALFHEETLTPDYFTFARIVTVLFIAGFIVLFVKNKFYFGVLSLGFLYNIYMFSPIQISWFVAERYLYFTIFIYCLMLGVFVNFLSERVSKEAAYIFVALFFFLSTYRTFLRFDDWRTNVNLWTANVKIAPDSHRVRNNLADSLSKEKRFAEAEVQFLQSIRINPNFAEAYLNLGNAYLQQGKLKEAEAVLLKSIELNPGIIDSYLNLGIIYANTNDFSKAYSYLDKVITSYPNFEQANLIKKEIQKYENSIKKN